MASQGTRLPPKVALNMPWYELAAVASHLVSCFPSNL
jgi:hypothetical protein